MYFSKKYKNALTNRFSHAMIYEVRTENQKDADVAQVVAHLIGSEEVTGPSPVISSANKREVLNKETSRFYISGNS